MNIYLIRHGETDYNVSHRFQGMWGESRLTERGKAQAAAGRYLLKDIPFDRIYSSAAIRTRETSAILFPDRRDIVFEDDMREIDVGRLTNLYNADARATYVEEFKIVDATLSYAMFGGESPADVAARAGRVIDRVIANGGETVAIVSHGAFIRYLLADLLGVTNTFFTTCDNCGVTLVKVSEKGKAALKFYNRVADTKLATSEAL